MTLQTEQFFLKRFFSIMIEPPTDPTDLARNIICANNSLVAIVGDWIKVANADHLAQTGKTLDLQYTLPVCEIVDGRIRIVSVVNMDDWSDDVSFGADVLEFFTRNCVKVVD